MYWVTASRDVTPTPRPPLPRAESVFQTVNSNPRGRGAVFCSPWTQGGGRFAPWPWAILFGPYRAESLFPCGIPTAPVSSQKDTGHAHLGKGGTEGVRAGFVTSSIASGPRQQARRPVATILWKSRWEKIDTAPWSEGSTIRSTASQGVYRNSGDREGRKTLQAEGE